MSNKLIHETSPYLLQHAENPVDWYPWCEAAFEKAKAEDKPIFLSIGYSTCHWCHVMAHESFENAETAGILNENFISIKVDREERPDIDSVYMAVCQAFTGSGGWPTSIFMTWDKKPFFAGTYYPIRSRYGMPGFSDLLEWITNKWKHNREELLQSADEVVNHLKNEKLPRSKATQDDLAEKAVQIFRQTFDKIYGGFGGAPKFPTPHNLLFLMMYAKLNRDFDSMKMAEATLTQMRLGGIFDHIGGGFSRYSTDKYYLAPHFEKMLYDNALLIIAYSAAYSMTGSALYLETAEKTAEYVLREMTSDGGGFHSAQDADSEGVEGKFYTFTLREIIDVLGEDRGERFAETFDVTEQGNFEGVNIPNLLKSRDVSADFTEELQKLYEYRKNRARLHLDDKILTAWNSMMSSAMAMLYRASHNERYLESAKRVQLFIEKNLCESGRLFTSYRDGKRSENGFLDDYAYYIVSLIELYNSTLDYSYLEKAKQLCEEAVKRFADSKGGFFLSEADSDELFINPKETYDGAIPSGNSVMAYNFVRLYQLTGDETYRSRAEDQMEYLASTAQDYPAGHSMFLLAKLMYDAPPTSIKIVTKTADTTLELSRELPFLANVSVVTEGGEYKLFHGETTYYVCRGNTCLPPSNKLEL